MPTQKWLLNANAAVVQWLAETIKYFWSHCANFMKVWWFDLSEILIVMLELLSAPKWTRYIETRFQYLVQWHHWSCGCLALLVGVLYNRFTVDISWQFACDITCRPFTCLWIYGSNAAAFKRLFLRCSSTVCAYVACDKSMGQLANSQLGSVTGDGYFVQSIAVGADWMRTFTNRVYFNWWLFNDVLFLNGLQLCCKKFDQIRRRLPHATKSKWKVLQRCEAKPGLSSHPVGGITLPLEKKSAPPLKIHRLRHRSVCRVACSGALWTEDTLPRVGHT